MRRSIFTMLFLRNAEKQTDMTGIIILAAGSSSRLGRPKQNLEYRGKTLLQSAVEYALAAQAGPVLVVLGANAGLIRPAIAGYDVSVLFNPDWQEGMASSIRAGIKLLCEKHPEADGAILMLCDQPFADTGLLKRLIATQKEAVIAASAYNDTIGPPALFDQFYFDELMGLKGSEGAKKVMLKYPDAVVKIPFPQGSTDIDTMDDYHKLTPPPASSAGEE